MKALIIDDIAMMRIVLRDALVRYCNFRKRDISEAADGLEAINKYKSEKPDIVFLDIAMPKMCGLEAVQELIKIDPKAKIVMCTSSGAEANVLHCIKAGAVDYITKPPVPKRIVQAVEKVFGPLNPDDAENEDEVDDQEADKNSEALKLKIQRLETQLETLKKIENAGETEVVSEDGSEGSEN